MYMKTTSFKMISILGLFALSIFLIRSSQNKQVHNTVKIDQVPKYEESYCFKLNTLHTPVCPYSSGPYMLPRHFPPIGIFFGYTQDNEHVDLLLKLVKIANQSMASPKLNLLIPRQEVALSYQSLRAMTNSAFRSSINMIPTPSDETLWSQDYMEFAYDLDKKEVLFIDLPYIDREGESLPTALSLICKAPLALEIGDDSDSYSNGDMGGNIESYPGDIILVGNNMLSDTKQKLKQFFTKQELYEVDVLFLETGHVDEIFSYLPDKSNSSCPFLLNYASPKLAIDLLNQSETWDQLLDSYYYDKSLFLSEEYEREDFSICFRSTKLNQNSKACRNLIQANQSYEKIIQKNLKGLVQKMSQKLNCQIPVKALPLLFAPAKVQEEYGGEEDFARSINPNPINNILLNSDLIIARQANRVFQAYTNDVFRTTGITPHYVNGNLMHYLSGGIHCTVNIVRACR